MIICDQTKPCPVRNQGHFCYRGQCYETSRLLAESLQLKSEQYTVAFQSRLGRTPWIQPYTDVVLEELVKKGFKRLVVMCPSLLLIVLRLLKRLVFVLGRLA